MFFIKLWLKKNKRLVWAIIIFLVAIFFRGYNLLGRLRWWDGDTSRDILVARHIAFLGDRPITGPDISGGAGYLVNSPVYYYMLALVYRLSDDVLTIPYFFVIAESVAVVICFWIMSELDIVLATIVGLAIAVNSYLSVMLKNSTQPFLLPLITVMSIYIWLRANNSGKILYFLLYIFVCLFSLHVHYAELTLFPVLLVGGILVCVKNRFYGKQWWKVVGWVLVWLMSWLMLTYGTTSFDQIRVDELLVKNNYSLWQLLENVYEIHLAVLFNMLGVSDKWLELLFWVFMYFGGGVVAVKSTRKEPICALVYGMMVSINFTAPMGGSQSVILLYVYPYYLVIFLEIFLLLRYFGSMVGWWITYCFATLFLLMSINFSYNFGFINRLNGQNKEVSMARTLSKIIGNDAIKAIGDYDIIYSDESTQNSRFGSSIFWYFLEKELGRKLVVAVDGEDHSATYFLPVNKSTAMVYLVCAQRTEMVGFFNNCEHSFLSKNKLEGKSYQSEKITENNDRYIRYKLFRMMEI